MNWCSTTSHTFRNNTFSLRISIALLLRKNLFGHCHFMYMFANKVHAFPSDMGGDNLKTVFRPNYDEREWLGCVHSIRGCRFNFFEFAAYVHASNSFRFGRITKVIIIITEIALGLTEFRIIQIEYALQINVHLTQRFIRSAIKINWLYYRITFPFQVNGAYNFSI